MQFDRVRVMVLAVLDAQHKDTGVWRMSGKGIERSYGTTGMGCDLRQLIRYWDSCAKASCGGSHAAAAHQLELPNMAWR